MIRLKRIYEPPDKEDGKRYLVERLWARGIRKEDAKLTNWLKEIAPSTELRKWYGHQVERWPEFQERYRAELRQPEKKAILADLARKARRGTITFVYAAKDEEHNSAAVLKKLMEHGACTGSARI